MAGSHKLSLLREPQSGLLVPHVLPISILQNVRDTLLPRAHRGLPLHAAIRRRIAAARIADDIDRVSRAEPYLHDGLRLGAA